MKEAIARKYRDALPWELPYVDDMIRELN